MGTRNLTMVISNGKTKVAQYGQWDGYPSGQGVTALKFLRETNMVEFQKKVNECSFLTEGEFDAIDDNNWKETHPQLSRDHGAKILQLVMNGTNKLKDSSAFAGDSLFCEWGYVVDLDKQTFEVYEGFNHELLTEKDRFFSMQKQDSNYKPITLVASYDLSALPTEEQFLQELEKIEDEEND